jgi:hypothetical protein
MYPQRELTRLAARKDMLRHAIAARRGQCARAATRVVQPIAWLDRSLSCWRELPPLARVAAVPLGFLVLRSALRRWKILRALVHWSPVVFGAARVFDTALKTHGIASPPVSVR